MPKYYDFIIVGSGAGGSAAAYKLATEGKSVLLLEKGHKLPADGSTLDVDLVFRQGHFLSKEQWVDRDGEIIVPEERFNLGGKTKWYGAALLRFGPEEFKSDEEHKCLAWPIEYGDLEPYYREAETILGVREFKIEPDLEKIVSGLKRNDPRWKDKSLPIGLSPDVFDHLDEAKHFDGFASKLGLKGDAQKSFLDPIKSRSNLQIETGNAVVGLRAAANRSQRVEGVVCADGSYYQGGSVLLASGSLHSPRLLQTYLEETGLSETLPSYQQVGRNYKFHVLTALLAISFRPVGDVLRKTAILLHESFPHSSVQNTGYVDGELFDSQAPAFVPQFVSNFIGKRAYGFWLTTEDGSHRDNRIIAKSSGGSRPQIDYDLNRLPAARKEHRRLLHTLQRQLLALGYVSFSKAIPVAGTAHACGTLVAGKDPSTSVVNPEGRVHGMDNLYVVDGSILPRSSRVNPALTIYAWGLRVATKLAAINPATLTQKVKVPL